MCWHQKWAPGHQHPSYHAACTLCTLLSLNEQSFRNARWWNSSYSTKFINSSPPSAVHAYVGELGQHLFRKWLVACLVPSHYLNQSWIIVNLTLRNKLQWNSNRNTKRFIHENTFGNVVCEMVAMLSWLNVSTCGLVMLHDVIHLSRWFFACFVYKHHLN